MATLYVHHKVNDYTNWRAVFDQVYDLRKEYGETGERVMRSANDPKELATLIEFGTAEQARAWATAPQLKEAMQRAGVITQPDLLILEDASSAQQLMKQVFGAIEANDFEGARALLSDDFKFSGAVPEPISADAWLGVHRALGAAMPDFSFHYIATGGSGDASEGTVQVGGTHTGEFVAPIPGIPNVPAAGKRILNPKERIWVTARNGKVTGLVVEKVPDAGLFGILKQMGAALA